jgi:hypothetical protein
LQVEVEPERAILSFYRIFKGESGSSFQTILQQLKASVDGKTDIFQLYELVATQSQGDTDREKLLESILQSLGSKEEDPLRRFDAMYCLRFKAGDDGWSAEQLSEHVAYSYDYICHLIVAGEDSVLTRKHFNMLKTLSDPDIFNHGDSSKLLGGLISENRLPKFESETEVVMQLGYKFLYSGSDAAARKAFAIALFQKAVEQQFDREVKITSYLRQVQV